MIEHLLAHHTDGILLAGTTAESPTLTHDEELQLFAAVQKVVNGRVPLIAGVGTNDTRDSIEFVKEVAEFGGFAAGLAIVPYYNKPSQEGMYQHFKAIAEATTLPIMVYNVPSRVGTGIFPTTLAQLHSEYPHVCAIKEASGNLMISSEIKRLMPDDDFMVYSGDDGLTLPMLSVGACGVVSVVSHVAGKDMNAMIQAYESGHNHEALVFIKLSGYHKSYVYTTNPIPVKYAVRKIGLPAGVFNLPMCDPSAEEAAYIDKALAEYVK